MFKLQPNPTFWAPVSIPVPGEAEEGKIDVEFKHKTKKELAAYLRPAPTKAAAKPADKPADPDAVAKKDLDDMLEIIADWKGLDGPFTATNLAVVLENYHGSAQAILGAYLKALLERRQKN